MSEPDMEPPEGPVVQPAELPVVQPAQPAELPEPEPAAEPNLQCPICFTMADAIDGSFLFCSSCESWIRWFNDANGPEAVPRRQQPLQPLQPQQELQQQQQQQQPEGNKYGPIRSTENSDHATWSLQPGPCSCITELHWSPEIRRFTAYHYCDGRMRSKGRPYGDGHRQQAGALLTCVRFLWQQHYAAGHGGVEPTLGDCERCLDRWPFHRV